MVTTLHGDCREQLGTLEAESVQTMVSSPPYYGLRKYSDDPREIGQEATPALYVAAMVEVFRQVRRVLRDDGTVWLNLGDSYASNGGAGGAMAATGLGSPARSAMPRPESTDPVAHGRWLRDWGVPDKNLLGIPWRVAFALQDDGWYLRSDIIWHKPNCMPESVTDRPTRAHEYLFLLTKSARYFYDADAIREPHQDKNVIDGVYQGKGGVSRPDYEPHTQGFNEGGIVMKDRQYNPAGRNRRTVWTIATQPYSGAHYATMPEALIAPCILAGSSAQACETCGAAWGRVVERETAPPEVFTNRNAPTDGMTHAGSTVNGEMRGHGQKLQDWRNAHPPTTTGFTPRCACPVNTGSAASVVLDPFGGSGTVGRVAARYQRNAVLIELNQAYIDDHIETRTDKLQVEMFV